MKKEVRREATKVGASVRNVVLKLVVRMNEVVGLSLLEIRFIVNS